ncbi:MAG: DUF3108 domain-containing protein [Paludibacter sp.]|nr:DUF3108 domain-containing protein [Paludibacter sp.]
MKHWLYIFLLIFTFPIFIFSQTKLKLNSERVIPGETLHYSAYWEFFNIGSASTVIDHKIYRIGSNICYKIEVQGQTNGLAKLFYVRDKWTAYIDTVSITTHRSHRSIREGKYELDEIAYFDHLKKKATVKVFDKKTKKYELKKVYDTPENIRDVVAGFMVVRLIDLSRYSIGDTIPINGFYEDEGYKINVIYKGIENLNLKSSIIRCHKLKPVLPKNKVFDGQNSIDIWLSADKSQSIIRIKAKMFVGNIVVELKE